MAQEYKYFRPGMKLQFYTETYDYSEQHFTGLTGEQPPLEVSFVSVNQSESLHFAAGESDIRGFSLNTPNGNTIGTVVGFLTDAANLTIPYAYIQTEEGRKVVVPVNQLMTYPAMGIVTLEGGKQALHMAPEAKMDSSDAARADHFWSEFRRENAA